MGLEPDPLDIPAFLVRDVNNKAEFMKMASVETATESRPAKSASKSKANGAAKASPAKAPIKATDKAKAKPAAKAAPAAKTAPKAAAKAAKPVKTAKVAKPKAETAKKDAYGFREGSTKSQAAALYARKSGATLAEVKDELGSVQLNVLVALEADGFKVEKKKEEREGARSVTRYFLKGKAK